MALYMYQAAYVGDSGQLNSKILRTELSSVGRAVCEAVGGKLVGSWYCFGEYDLIIIADVPDNASMTAIAVGVAAGGAVKSAKDNRTDERGRCSRRHEESRSSH